MKDSECGIVEDSWGNYNVLPSLVGTARVSRSRPSSGVSVTTLEFDGGPYFKVSGEVEAEFRLMLRQHGIQALRCGYDQPNDTSIWHILPWKADSK